MATVKGTLIVGGVAVAVALGMASAAPAAAKPDPRPTPHPAATTTTPPPALGGNFDGGGGPLSFIAYLGQENANLVKQAQQAILGNPRLDQLLLEIFSPPTSAPCGPCLR